MSIGRFKFTFRPIDERAGELAESLPLLSVSQYRGVVPRAELAGDEGRAAELTNYKTCKPGDIVLNRMSAYNGAVGLASQRGLVSPDYLVMRPQSHMSGRYMAYLIRSHWFVGEMTSRVRGIGSVDSGAVRTPRIGLPELGGIVVDVPELDEQRAIADYLDRETAQIDAFIAKNEELITLLTERRAAVIELAIQEGAGATAKLGVLLRGLKDGTHGSFARIESPHPLLGARNVQGGQLVLDGNESTISEDDHNTIVANGFPRRGDVLLVIVGATIGKSAVYERAESLSFQRSVAFLRPGRLLTPKFLWYYTQTRAFQDEVWLRAKVSAQPGLYLGDVASIPIALPDVTAQQRITAKLDRDVVAIDEATSVAKTAIELARERRAALISAAVTGKIDVGGTA